MHRLRGSLVRELPLRLRLLPYAFAASASPYAESESAAASDLQFLSPEHDMPLLTSDVDLYASTLASIILYSTLLARLFVLHSHMSAGDQYTLLVPVESVHCICDCCSAAAFTRLFALPLRVQECKLLATFVYYYELFCVVQFPLRHHPMADLSLRPSFPSSNPLSESS